MAAEELTLSLDTSAIMDFLASAQKLLETGTITQKEEFATDISVVTTFCETATEIDRDKIVFSIAPSPAAIACLRKHGGY